MVACVRRLLNARINLLMFFLLSSNHTSSILQVGHGNYKWKNIGATMWKAKQAGKSAQFWKKNEGGTSSDPAAR